MSNPGDREYLEGFVFERKGDLDAAVVCFGNAIEQCPGNEYYYSVRGDVNADRGDFEAAIKDFTRAICIKPHTDYYEARGDAFLENGQYRLAIKDYDEVIRLAERKKDSRLKKKPDRLHQCFMRVHLARGIAYWRLDEYDQTFKCFDEAMLLKPGSGDVHFIRASCYKAIQNYLLAIEDYKEILRQDAHDDEVYFELGFAYEQLGEINQAISMYTESLHQIQDARTYARSGHIYHRRGLLYQKTGDGEKANSDLARANELGCTPPEVVVGETIWRGPRTRHVPDGLLVY